MRLTGSGRSGGDARAGGRPRRARQAGGARAAERSRAKGVRPSRWLPAVRDRGDSRNPSVLSLNNTRWPTRRHARHVTARWLRPAPAPPRPSSLPAPPASHGVLPFRHLPPVFPGRAPARTPDVRREEGGAAAERRRLRVPGPELSPLALELSGVGIHSWIWASRHVTHRRVRPVQSPLAVQKALHRLGADFPHQNFSTGFHSAFSLLISHPREKRGRDTLKFKAVCLLVNGSGRTGNHSRVLESDSWGGL